MHQFIANCGRFCWHANGACSTDLCWQQWALGLQQPFASFSTVAIFRMDFLHSAPPAVFSCPIEAMRIAVKTVAKLAKLLWQKWCAAVADFRLFRIAISLCSLLCFFFFLLANCVFVRTFRVYTQFVCLRARIRVRILWFHASSLNNTSSSSNWSATRDKKHQTTRNGKLFDSLFYSIFFSIIFNFFGCRRRCRQRKGSEFGYCVEASIIRTCVL